MGFILKILLSYLKQSLLSTPPLAPDHMPLPRLALVRPVGRYHLSPIGRRAGDFHKAERKRASVRAVLPPASQQRKPVPRHRRRIEHNHPPPVAHQFPLPRPNTKN